MNRSVRALLFAPLVALGIGGAFTIACRGGGTLDGLDASFRDGETTRFNALGAACEKAMITIDEGAAAEGGDGGAGCASDDECTVRMEGDYCACPNTPRPVLVARAAEIDYSLGGITNKCTCEISPCEPVRQSRAICRERRCVLADTP